MKCLVLLSETRLLPVCSCTKGDCCMPAFELCSRMRAALCAKEHKLGQNPLVPAKMRGRPPRSNSLLSLVLIPAKAAGNKKQKLPLHHGLYVKQGQEMLVWFLLLQLAGLLLTGLQHWMPVVPVSGQLGSTYCWQRVDSMNLASSGLTPLVAPSGRRKFPAASRDSLKSSLLLEWCKGNLTWTWYLGSGPKSPLRFKK